MNKYINKILVTVTLGIGLSGCNSIQPTYTQKLITQKPNEIEKEIFKPYTNLVDFNNDKEKNINLYLKEMYKLADDYNDEVKNQINNKNIKTKGLEYYDIKKINRSYKQIINGCFPCKTNCLLNFKLAKKRIQEAYNADLKYVNNNKLILKNKLKTIKSIFEKKKNAHQKKLDEIKQRIKKLQYLKSKNIAIDNEDLFNQYIVECFYKNKKDIDRKDVIDYFGYVDGINMFGSLNYIQENHTKIAINFSKYLYNNYDKRKKLITLFYYYLNNNKVISTQNIKDIFLEQNKKYKYAGLSGRDEIANYLMNISRIKNIKAREIFINKISSLSFSDLDSYLSDLLIKEKLHSSAKK